MMQPKDFTAQEKLIAGCLSSLGIRYAQQVFIDKYCVDFYLDMGDERIVIEADGLYGHFSKADEIRDTVLRERGVTDILHIRAQSKSEIHDILVKHLCLV